MKKETFRFGLSGLLTGLVNGFFGAGDGMVLIPLLTRLCGLEDKKAFASSVCIVLPICLVTIAVCAMKGSFQAQGALPYLLGGAAGGVISGLTFRKVPALLLHRALGALILWGGVRLLLR